MGTNRITFGEWLPDQPGVIGALTTAKNCFPKAVGYGAFPQEVDYSDPAPQDLTNAVAAKNSAGNVTIYASGTTRLFKLNTSTFAFDDISATTYSGTTGWKFTQFGTSLIAANESNTMQYIDVINRDSNLDSAGKTRAIAQIYYNLQTQLRTLSQVSKVDVTRSLSLANAPGFDKDGNYVGFDESGNTIGAPPPAKPAGSTPTPEPNRPIRPIGTEFEGGN